MCRAARPLATLALICAAGCAPAIPLWGGASTTPKGRGDVTLGGAARVGLGDMNPANAPAEVEPYVRKSQGSGVTPAAALRHGIADHTDLGLTVAGPLARLDVRQELILADDLVPIALVLGVGPYVGWLGSETDGEDGVRVGGDIPLLLGVDALSFLQVWIGARVGVEHAFGELEVAGAIASASATGFRVGGVFGLALGFRHLWVMLELTGGWETWSGDLGATQLDVSGAVLMPAFALRFRL